MLFVDFNPDRVEGHGQFYVQLADNHHTHDLKHINRFGYWCDEVHLKAMQQTINTALAKAIPQQKSLFMDEAVAAAKGFRTLQIQLPDGCFCTLDFNQGWAWALLSAADRHSWPIRLID